jgi:hypothetical protein
MHTTAWMMYINVLWSSSDKQALWEDRPLGSVRDSVRMPPEVFGADKDDDDDDDDDDGGVNRDS